MLGKSYPRRRARSRHDHARTPNASGAAPVPSHKWGRVHGKWPSEPPVRKRHQRGAGMWAASQSPRATGIAVVPITARCTSHGGRAQWANSTVRGGRKSQRAWTRPQDAGGRHQKRQRERSHDDARATAGGCNRKPHRSPRGEERQYQAPRCEPPALVLGALACRSNTTKANAAKHG